MPDPELHEEQGSNLMDSKPSVVIREPVLLELSRELVDVGTFESYTYTGTIFNKSVSPHSLPFRHCCIFFHIFRTFILFGHLQTL